MSPLDEFPAELALKRAGGRWLLAITGPDLHGTAASSSQDMVLAIAETYARMRRAEGEAVSA
jgi:hypothetical protein